MKKILLTLSLIYSGVFFGISSNAIAQDSKENNSKNEFIIQIKEHKFVPDKIEAKADQPFKLVIENLDNTIEEFESDDLKKEKLVGAGKKITLNIQPLKEGEYKFYGDFHQKTAQGVIIVK